MPSKRIEWIDATKGLLILLMVFGHVPNIAGGLGVYDFYLTKCVSFSSLYSCFFMQAFLILTGYTSNFEKDTPSFLKSLFKTVLIPWLSFSLICQLYRFFNGGEGLFIVINEQSFFFLFEDFWFLHVIFFGKLVYYYLYKYVNKDYLRALVLLVMMIGGFTVFSLNDNSEVTYHYYNYLHYKDILCMSFFIWLGNYCRRKNVLRDIKGRALLIISFFYILGHALRLLFRMQGWVELLIAPVVISHGGNALSPAQVPAYIYYVVLGSFLCFGLMQYINRCKLLEYFGRNSLVVYCVHFIFLGIYISIINSIIQPVDLITAIIFIATVMILCILSCSLVIFITKYKPFNYIIGKF